jgi:hypothetical protein
MSEFSKQLPAGGEIDFVQQDGLADIFLGLCMLVAGMTMATQDPFPAAIMPAILWPLFLSFRKSVTLPRVESLTLSPERRSRLRGLTAVSFGLLLALIAVYLVRRFIVTGGVLPLSVQFWAGLALFSLLFIHAAGIVLGIRRMYLYGSLALAIYMIFNLLGASIFVSMAIYGGLLLAAGIVVLFRFLRLNPVDMEVR